MGASRESFNIFGYIERKNWKKVGYILSSIKNKYERDLIIKDSLMTPFNKKVGCRFFGHRWSTDEESRMYDFDDFYYCWKCGKWETKLERRDSKIGSLLK